jgi:sugar lactone lactonase YvrE
MTSVDVLDRHSSRLGEGPVWDWRTGEVVWVDILGRVVHALALETGAKRLVATPTHVGAVVPRRTPGIGWLALLAAGPALLDEDGGVTRLGTFAEANGDQDEVAIRANDAKCDPRGRCIIGTTSYAGVPHGAALYRLDPDEHVPVKLLDGTTISNGLAWSADGRTMYFIDSPTQRVDAYAYHLDTGMVSDCRTVVEIPASAGLPDGMAIDADGCLWVAIWGGGAIHRYTPGGRLDRVVKLPCARVTSCAFVGESLDRLVVTTATHGLDRPEPLAGSLFIVDPGVRGATTFPFGG